MDSEDEQYASDENSVGSDEDYGGYGDDEDYEDDYDDGQGYLDDVGESMSVHKAYDVLSDDNIRQHQEDDVMEVSNVLSISRAAASVLLFRYNWNVSRVSDVWFADEEKVRGTVGLLEEPVVCYSDSMEVICKICFESYRRSSIYAASCGHPFCCACWEGYITTSINDGPGCLLLHCPEPSCKAAVTQDMVEVLVSDEGSEKYSRYLLRSYVENSRKIKWCPAPACDYAVEIVLGSGSYDVTCNCMHTFCWNCTEDAHRPVDCDTVGKWILKNSAESNNVAWMLVNTKPCPNCNRSIEKNQGCMHMTCSLCHHKFCWLCFGKWSEHNDESGDYYQCNSYKKDKREGKYAEAEKKRAVAKKALEKYTHYYKRWAANQKSREKAIADLFEMKTVHIERLRTGQCQILSELNFITEAWQQIVECRRVLKWTYAYGYYLPDHKRTKTRLFEYLQSEAESGLERLHECAEKELKVYLDAEAPSKDFNDFRTKLVGLTVVTKNYFENLVHALENGLDDVNGPGDSGRTQKSKGKGKGRSLLDEEDDGEDVFDLGIMFELG